MISSFVVFHYVIQLILLRHLVTSIAMWSARFTVYFLTSPCLDEKIRAYFSTSKCVAILRKLFTCLCNV